MVLYFYCNLLPAEDRKYKYTLLDKKIVKVCTYQAKGPRSIKMRLTQIPRNELKDQTKSLSNIVKTSNTVQAEEAKG